MKSEHAQRQLALMIKNIDAFQKGDIALFQLIQTLWALFEAIDQKEKNASFSNAFHDSWDALDEIVATKREAQYTDTIMKKICKLKKIIKNHWQ